MSEPRTSRAAGPGDGRPVPAVRLHGVFKRFGTVEAVRGVSLEVQAGEFFSLLGPSGCGKTTLLRTIAGFEHPDEGTIEIAGREVTRVPPQSRPTGMVFQNYALFPTMTVGENVAYGLRVRKVDARQRRARVHEVLARVDLDGFEDKPVTELSGGQQQRVALARAIAVQPAVLLFDEPLSNLDVALREQTRRELKLLQHTLGVTSLYVTHDQQEALALSDRVGVMRAGELLEVGAPEALYQAPETAFVAQFLGSNLVRQPALATALTGEHPPEGRVLAVRPEHLAVAEAGGAPVHLRSRQFLGQQAEWWMEASETTLRAWVDPDRAPTDTLRIRAKQYRWVREA